MAPARPLRTCIACRSKRFQHELLRIVRTPEQTVEIDPDKTKPGRGAYLCFREDCFSLAVKRKAVSRHLKIAQPDDFLQQLLKVLHARN